jgi:hypothetical protein
VRVAIQRSGISSHSGNGESKKDRSLDSGLNASAVAF